MAQTHLRPVEGALREDVERASPNRPMERSGRGALAKSFALITTNSLFVMAFVGSVGMSYASAYYGHFGLDRLELDLGFIDAAVFAGEMPWSSWLRVCVPVIALRVAIPLVPAGWRDRAWGALPGGRRLRDFLASRQDLLRAAVLVLCLCLVPLSLGVGGALIPYQPILLLSAAVLALADLELLHPGPLPVAFCAVICSVISLLAAGTAFAEEHGAAKATDWVEMCRAGKISRDDLANDDGKVIVGLGKFRVKLPKDDKRFRYHGCKLLQRNDHYYVVNLAGDTICSVPRSAPPGSPVVCRPVHDDAGLPGAALKTVLG